MQPKAHWPHTALQQASEKCIEKKLGFRTSGCEHGQTCQGYEGKKSRSSQVESCYKILD